MRDNVPAKLSHSSLNVLGKRVIRQQSAGSSSLKLIMQQFIGQNGLTTARIAKQQKTRPAWDRPSNHLFQMLEPSKRRVVPFQHNNSPYNSQNAAYHKREIS